MKRVWIVLAVMSVMVCSTIPATAAGNRNSPCAISPKQPVVASLAGLNGRLGGTRASWDEMYGSAVASPSASVPPDAPSYVWKGCGSQSGGLFVVDRAVWIYLQPHRPENTAGTSMSEPDDANWTVEEALKIARKLAPADAVLETPQETPGGNTILFGTSALLEANASWDVYGAAKVAGPPGEFEIRLSLDSAGEVYAIDVALRGYTID